MMHFYSDFYLIFNLSNKCNQVIKRVVNAKNRISELNDLKIFDQKSIQIKNFEINLLKSSLT